MSRSAFLRMLHIALFAIVIIAGATSFAQHGGGFRGGGFHSGAGSFGGFHYGGSSNSFHARGINSFNHGGYGYYGPHYHHHHSYYGGYYGYPGYGYRFSFGFGPFWGFWGYPSAYGYYPAPYPYYAPYGYYRRYAPSNAPDDQTDDTQTVPHIQRDGQRRCDYRYENTCKNDEHRQGTPSGATPSPRVPRVYVTSSHVR